MKIRATRPTANWRKKPVSGPKRSNRCANSSCRPAFSTNACTFSWQRASPPARPGWKPENRSRRASSIGGKRCGWPKTAAFKTPRLWWDCSGTTGVFARRETSEACDCKTSGWRLTDRRSVLQKQKRRRSAFSVERIELSCASGALAGANSRGIHVALNTAPHPARLASHGANGRDDHPNNQRQHDGIFHGGGGLLLATKTDQRSHNRPTFAELLRTPWQAGVEESRRNLFAAHQNVRSRFGFG